MPFISSRTVEFTTPGLELVSKTVQPDDSVHYSVRVPDNVAVIALTAEGQLVLVHQYRAAVERYTLELPHGHVGPGETPEQAAIRELEKETGYSSEQIELLGVLLPDTGRNENKLWCYLAKSVIKTAETDPESDTEILLIGQTAIPDLIRNGEFNHAQHLAVLVLALAMQGQEIGPLTL